MSKKKAKLTVVVGLPGSGKSTLLKSLKKTITGILADDFMKDVAPGSPIVRDPSVTDSRHYPALVRNLRSGKSCLISDIIFCDTLVRAELELAVRNDVRNLDLKWEFFDNNPQQCISNARHRGRQQKILNREVQLIQFLSRKYFVPERIKTRAVGKAKKRITKRGTRTR